MDHCDFDVDGPPGYGGPPGQMSEQPDLMIGPPEHLTGPMPGPPGYMGPMPGPYCGMSFPGPGFSGHFGPIHMYPQFRPRGGFLGRPPMPQPFIQFPVKIKSQPMTCDVCDLTLNSQSVYETHLNGRIHKRNLAIQNGEISDPKLPKISSKKKVKPAIVFEAQSQSTRGQVPLDKFYKKCEVCSLYLNSKRQWEIHIAGSKHAKAVLLSKTKFNPSGIVSEIKTESPTQVEKIETVSSPPPITVTLPRGIVVIDNDLQKFVCDYCNNKPLNSMFQIEQHLKSNEHLKRSGARFTPIGQKTTTANPRSQSSDRKRKESNRSVKRRQDSDWLDKRRNEIESEDRKRKGNVSSDRKRKDSDRPKKERRRDDSERSERGRKDRSECSNGHSRGHSPLEVNYSRAEKRKHSEQDLRSSKQKYSDREHHDRCDDEERRSCRNSNPVEDLRSSKGTRHRGHYDNEDGMNNIRHRGDGERVRHTSTSKYSDDDRERSYRDHHLSKGIDRSRGEGESSHSDRHRSSKEDRPYPDREHRSLTHRHSSSSSTAPIDKLELIEFLDKAYSDRMRPVEREKSEERDRSNRRYREPKEKSKFRDDRSADDDDRWGSYSGGFPSIRENFVSSGVHKV